MKRTHRLVITYGLLTVIGIVMVYPLLWMISASFKTNREIFSSLSLMPTEILWDGYSKGWQSSGQYTFATDFANTFVMVIPTVLLTVASSLPVAYGFARFRFKGKGLLFTLVIASLMLPTEVIIIPRYMLFNKLGWLDSYMTFYAPAAVGCYPFFVFMMVQFLRGLPRDLDESACIDGCGPFQTFFRIIMPQLKPVTASVVIITGVNCWNNYQFALYLLQSPKIKTITLAIAGFFSADSANVNGAAAAAFLGILPVIVVFLFLQKYFIQGMVDSAIK